MCQSRSLETVFVSVLEGLLEGTFKMSGPVPDSGNGNSVPLTCSNKYLIWTPRSSFPPRRSIIVFQFPSRLASADPCFNSVRSEIYRPWWHPCASCHVAAVVVHLVSEIFCCNARWPFSTECGGRRATQRGKIELFYSSPRSLVFLFHHSFESYHFLDFYSWKPPLIRWMLDLRVLLSTRLLTVFSIFCV